MAKLKEGDKAPDFVAKDQNGNKISLKSFQGKKVIMYFYPKDDTPGCTAEACNLRDNYNELINKGFIVLGVSSDNEQSHQKFIQKYELPFILISDTDKQVIKLYDAWGEKKMYGKTYEGIIRKTYILDENRQIEKIIEKVDTKNHTRQIINELKI